MASKSDRKEEMRRLREQGLKQREIAEMFGVSIQYVSLVCGKGNPARFVPVSSNCVYPNLRKWMNENKVSKSELLRRMGMDVNTSNSLRLGAYMLGETYPRKPYIDKLLAATGLTYEVLFYEGEC